MAREKKWLFDKGKTSKSRKRWSYGGDFADERNTKNFRDIEDAPKKSGMKTGKVFNNRLSFRPLRRFLRANVGKDWNAIYSEIKERMPADIWEYHRPAEMYVAVKVEIMPDGSIINTQGWGVSRVVISKDGVHSGYRYGAYYVHPVTNELCYLKSDTSRREGLTPKEGKKKAAIIKQKNRKEKIHKKKYIDEVIAKDLNILKEKKRQTKNEAGQGN